VHMSSETNCLFLNKRFEKKIKKLKLFFYRPNKMFLK
jgi:hypothetical protein